MKKGFTLAEVLITLAVIGVVAALTIPVLVNKYQKKQMYTQFMKAYNTFSKVMDNAVAEYGDTDTWKWGHTEKDEETGEYIIVGADDPVGKNVFPLMKVVKQCEQISDCFASDYTYLDGGDDEEEPLSTVINEYAGEYGGKAVVLADGTTVVAYGENSGNITFIIDTNGKKAPNIMGRDLFVINYIPMSYNGENGIVLEEYDPDGEYDTCSTDESESGEGCASRMLQEGAMNY